MNLQNQIAVVTGGSSGIGEACVIWFAKLGMQVVVWDKNPAAHHSHFITCDVTSATSAEQAMHQTIEQVGTPRICVNCAGIAPAKRMVGKEGVVPLEHFTEVIAVNLIGTFNVMRLHAEVMSQLEPLEDGERGVIINTASIAAFEGQIGQVAYSASKAGVVGMTLPAARELAPLGIRVNTIAPGLIATPMLLNMPSSVQESLALSVPFPKRFGKPQEFAALAQHIIENSMINGEVIRLDGALRMQAK